MCVCMCVFPFFNGFCDQRQHPRSDKLKLSPQGDTVATEQANHKKKKKKKKAKKKQKKKSTVFHEDTREEKQTIQTKHTQTSKKRGEHRKEDFNHHK